VPARLLCHAAGAAAVAVAFGYLALRGFGVPRWLAGCGAFVYAVSCSQLVSFLTSSPSASLFRGDEPLRARVVLLLGRCAFVFAAALAVGNALFVTRMLARY